MVLMDESVNKYRSRKRNKLVRNKRKVTVNLLTVCVQWRASASSTGSSRSELRRKDCLVGHEMETYS